ncbi:18339_t:CDS:2, partial [Racocetra fulgida]
ANRIMADNSGIHHGKQTGPSHFGATDIPLPTSNTDDFQTVYVNPKSFGYFKFKLRGAFAELLGTFVFVTFGIGSIAQAKLGDAFLAAAVVFLNYHTAIVEFGGGKLSVK